MTTSIDCELHGRSHMAVVCRHMIGADAPVGFIENSSDPEDLQAWCGACEAMFLVEDGLTEAFRAFNGMAVVCAACYDSMKARHGAPSGMDVDGNG